MTMLDPKALEALKNNQRQLDMDGCEVGVSRQALEELIAAYEALSTATPADVAGLVERLRVNAASWRRDDALVARDESEGDLADEAADNLQSVAAERDALSARCGEMERALEPFAKLAAEVFHVDEGGREMNAGKSDDASVWGFDRAMLTYGDLRHARAALSRRATGGE